MTTPCKIQASRYNSIENRVRRARVRTRACKKVCHFQSRSLQVIVFRICFFVAIARFREKIEQEDTANLALVMIDEGTGNRYLRIVPAKGLGTGVDKK